MENLPIAELTPELPNLDSKQFRAVVRLLWPFSSSTRQCALLLVEPDFRLRNKKGQVRVRFTGSSARAIAETGVGIGDEVVIGLRGAQFVQETVDIRTPGKSLDWELTYSQTLVVQVRRNLPPRRLRRLTTVVRYFETERNSRALISSALHPLPPPAPPFASNRLRLL